MEQNRKIKLIVILILCVAIIGLSIGFAAFTRNLNITFSDSNVEVSGDLDIKFLVSDDLEDKSTIVQGTFPEGLEAISVNNAIINSDRNTISGIGGTFNNKDQGFGYEFYIYNSSEYNAYLKGIDFLNYTGSLKNKICTAMEGTNQSLVNDACEDIHISLVVSGEIIFDTSTNDFSSVKISKGEVAIAAIIIFYAGPVVNEQFFGTTDSALLPNGDFKVNFGDVKFNFSSLEG